MQAPWIETLEGKADLAVTDGAEEDVVGEAEAEAPDLECAARPCCPTPAS
jgi:hypothetical protein